MSPVCSEPAHTGVRGALLEPCLSKNSRRRALWSSASVQPKGEMEEWKGASFKGHHEGNVFADKDKLLVCRHPISQKEK